MTYPSDILDAAHRHSSNHRDELERSWICGCFYCCQTCDAAEVKHWLNEGTGTALCPNCAIDAIIGAASGYPVNEPPFLKAMHERWFSLTDD
jgi:hypothetical protein